MTPCVDLNCDVGESFGVYSLGQDAALFACVTSVNIACGFHAGDPATMRKTVQLAAEKGVAIGAHPGLPDLVGFGRRRMEISPQDAYDLVVYQTGALEAFVRAEGVRLHHVKPHGALYNMAAADAALADAIADAVHRFNPGLVLVGLAGSELIRAGEARGLQTASEVFADRGYECDGSLIPRGRPGALISDPKIAAERAATMVLAGTVLSSQGTEISLSAETICIHGDAPHAVEFARAIRARLETLGIVVAAIAK
jgi:UPF0271 protein